MIPNRTQTQPRGGMAKTEDFLGEIESARARAEELRSAAGESRLRDDDLLMDAIEQLQTTIEELRVAQEELRQQNEELLASRSELELQQERYRDLFEFAPDGYLITDKDGKIQEANVAATRLLGLDQRFLLNKPLVSFIAETDRHTLRKKLNSLSQSVAGRVEELGIQISPRIGNPYDAELRVGVSRDDKGKPTRLRWLVRDITDRKRVEEQIRALNAELE